MGVLDNNGLQRLWSHIQAGFNDLQSQINNLTNTENSKLIIDSQNYGTTLPSTGVEGQVFFKKVT